MNQNSQHRAKPIQKSSKPMLDVITIGRSSVDLYGSQFGGRLEDMRSFDKYIGGSPTNIACGTSRLGLRSGLITRVGDEHMGRFIVEQLRREGVDTHGVITDPARLTALVLLGIRDEERFPLIFYRDNCADMALSESDIDEVFVANTRSLVATGTHLSHPNTKAAVLKALQIARDHGARTALDIDYRPNLWGLAGHGAGDERFLESADVTEALQSTLHLFDLIVGTEEEFHIAGGSTDTIEALREIRNKSDAILVCKRGPMGASAFEGAIPNTLEEGISGTGFQIEVFNVLGAGDGFMSGLLSGWLDDQDWSTTLRYANACGALAVSRHGCTPAYPSREELEFFLERGVRIPELRNDAALEQIHWSTNRATDWPELRVLAFDHRAQLEEMPGADKEKISRFKELCLEAVSNVANGASGYGFLCDARLGQSALHRATGQGLWIGRPVEWPSSRPLLLEPEIGPDYGGLSQWPADQVVKVLCFYHPDDSSELRAEQEQTVQRLFHACRRNRLEFLLEVIPSKFGSISDDTTAKVIARFYEIGVYPDWWKLEPMKTEAAWDATCAVIKDNDPHCRGIVVLGLDAKEEDLVRSFAIAARYSLVKGFAVGRTIFADSARAFMLNTASEAEVIEQLTTNFRRLCDVWSKAKARSG